MRRAFALLTVFIGTLLLVPGTALAKGATGAHITGGGSGNSGGIGTISIDGDGESGSGSALSKLADQSGFWAEAYGQQPDPTLDSAPSGDLGIFYTITYDMPSPNGGVDHLTQRIYPYAPGGPVTYMASGQSFFGGEKTSGGWFRASDALKQTLVDLGISAKPPVTTTTAPATTAATSSLGWPAVVVAAVLVLLVGATIVMLRRRMRPSAAA
jgi:hypothetical protein